MNMIRNTYKNTIQGSAGFTLLEAIIAIFVVTIAIVGITGLIAQSLSLTRSTANEAIAWYLAQEGIEIVRNIRDSNYLNPAVLWDANFSAAACNDFAGGDVCDADYNDPALVSGNGVIPLNYEITTGLYSHDAGSSASPFTRGIAVLRPVSQPNAVLQVTVRVDWEEKGVDRQVELRTELYNWEDP